MKAKITIKNLGLTLGAFLVILFSIDVNAQACTGNQVTLSIDNITATATTIEYDVFLKNTGVTPLLFSCYSGNVLYENNLLPTGATGELSVVTQPSATGNFPTLFDITTNHAAATRQLRWAQNSVVLASGNTVSLPANTLMKFARFRFTSSIPWDLNTESSLAFATTPTGGVSLNNVMVYCNQNSVNTPLSLANGNLILENDAITAHISMFRLLSTTTVDAAVATKAFPNPFSNGFKLNMEIATEELVTIKVYDMLGKQVEERHVKTADISKQEFGNNYQAGLYNVIISKNEVQQTIRVIKK
jgi:hypothetical protein